MSNFNEKLYVDVTYKGHTGGRLVLLSQHSLSYHYTKSSYTDDDDTTSHNNDDDDEADPIMASEVLFLALGDLLDVKFKKTPTFMLRLVVEESDDPEEDWENTQHEQQQHHEEKPPPQKTHVFEMASEDDLNDIVMELREQVNVNQRKQQHANNIQKSLTQPPDDPPKERAPAPPVFDSTHSVDTDPANFSSSLHDWQKELAADFSNSDADVSTSSHGDGDPHGLPAIQEKQPPQVSSTEIENDNEDEEDDEEENDFSAQDYDSFHDEEMGVTSQLLQGDPDEFSEEEENQGPRKPIVQKDQNSATNNYESYKDKDTDQQLDKSQTTASAPPASSSSSEKNETSSSIMMMMACFACLFLTAIIILLSILVVRSKQDKSNTSKDLPTNTNATTLSFDLFPDETVQAIQSDPTSPQARAYDWLSRHPQVQTTNNQQMDDWKKQQLMALATFYYAMDGDNWPYHDKKNWLTHSTVPDECSWSVRDKIILECADDGRVRSLGMAGEGDIPWFYDDYYPDDDPTKPVTTDDNNMGEEMSRTASNKAHKINKEDKDYDKASNIFAHHRHRHRRKLQDSPTQRLAIQGKGIPKEITMLSSLEHLVVIGTTLNTTLESLIPPFLSNLSSLSMLVVSVNENVYGTLPTYLGELTTVTELIINISPLVTGTIPSELALLDLQNLELFDMGLTGTIPPDLVIHNASYLGLGSNQLTGTIPAGLWNISQVDLSNNKLTGTIPVIPWDSYTWFLNLSFNALTGPVPNNDYIVYLDLGHNQLDSLPNDLSLSANNLWGINLSNNNLAGNLTTELGLLWNLIELNLANNSALVGPIPSELGSLPYLALLNVEGTSLTGAVPIEICMKQPDISMDCGGSISCPFRCGDCGCPVDIVNSSKYWDLLDEGCAIDDSCIKSHPEAGTGSDVLYSNNMACRFRAKQSGTLSTVIFDTEIYSDTLLINGTSFSGSSSNPTGMAIEPGFVYWETDEANQYAGFVVCFSGNEPVVKSSDYWDLMDPGCDIDGGCIKSHPDAGTGDGYSTSMNCRFRAKQSGSLSVVSFDTELNLDVLVVGDTEYSGQEPASGPEGVSVSADDILTWSSDSVFEGFGFVICFEGTAPDPPANQTTTEQGAAVELPLVEEESTDAPDEESTGAPEEEISTGGPSAGEATEGPSSGENATQVPVTVDATEVVVKTSDYWDMLNRGCDIDEGCIKSHPDAGTGVDYPSSSICRFRAKQSGSLSVVSFDTEEGADELVVGEASYSGRGVSSGPVNVSLTEGDILSWASDGSVSFDGFIVCFAGVELDTPPLPSSDYWEVYDRGCSIDGGCIKSHPDVGNGTSTYSSYAVCTFKAKQAGSLSVISFETEGVDRLEVAGVFYSGSSGPEGVTVNADDILTWTSDGSNELAGFVVCFAGAAPGV